MSISDMDKAAFFAALRRRNTPMFGDSLSARQVDGINGILRAFDDVGDGRVKTLAYALATARHETGGLMVPIKETVMPWHKDKFPSDATVIRRLDRWAEKTGRTRNIYWRPDPKTGRAYFGRGHVQLTWKENYSRSSADAGVDLVTNPDAMLDPVISARVLILGLIDGRWNGFGQGLAYYLPDDGEDDLRGARRTVNLTDKWDVVAGYYQQFMRAIEPAMPEKPQDAPESPLPIDLPDDPGMDEVPAGGRLSALFRAILALLKGFKR